MIIYDYFSFTSFISATNVDFVILQAFYVVLQNGSIKIEAQCSKFQLNDTLSFITFSTRASNISSSFESFTQFNVLVKRLNPCLVLGHIVYRSVLQSPQIYFLFRIAGYFIPVQLHMQYIVSPLILYTIKLNAEYSFDSFNTSINRSFIFLLTNSGQLPICSVTNQVRRKDLTSCPLDFPGLNAGKSQLVRMTIIPVLIFIPNHVPVDFISRPAQILGSQANGPIFRVCLQDCSSLLNDNTNFIFCFFVPYISFISYYFNSCFPTDENGCKQKNVMHISILFLILQQRIFYSHYNIQNDIT